MILQVAREQAEKVASQGAESEAGMKSQAGHVTSEEAASTAAVSVSSNGSSSVSAIASTPLSVAPPVNPPAVVNVTSSTVSVGHSATPTNMAVVHSPAPAHPAGTGDAGASPAPNVNSGSTYFLVLMLFLCPPSGVLDFLGSTSSRGMSSLILVF